MVERGQLDLEGGIDTPHTGSTGQLDSLSTGWRLVINDGASAGNQGRLLSCQKDKKTMLRGRLSGGRRTRCCVQFVIRIVRGLGECRRCLLVSKNIRSVSVSPLKEHRVQSTSSLHCSKANFEVTDTL